MATSNGSEFRRVTHATIQAALRRRVPSPTVRRIPEALSSTLFLGDTRLFYIIRYHDTSLTTPINWAVRAIACREARVKCPDFKIRRVVISRKSLLPYVQDVVRGLLAVGGWDVGGWERLVEMFDFKSVKASLVIKNKTVKGQVTCNEGILQFDPDKDNPNYSIFANWVKAREMMPEADEGVISDWVKERE